MIVSCPNHGHAENSFSDSNLFVAAVISPRGSDSDLRTAPAHAAGRTGRRRRRRDPERISGERVTPRQIGDRAARLATDGYGVWLASNADVLSRLETAPAGVGVETIDILGPETHAWTIADLMRVYNRLNAASFGEKGIPLQNWVMIDLGLLPSAFLLLTLPAPRARAAAAAPDAATHTRRVLGEVLAEADRLGHRGPVPVAGYCAAATPEPGAWVGWSLCSAIPGLGTVAKGLGLLAYRARRLTGVAQFHDPALRVHRKFGAMRLRRAVLDLHEVPHTMVYETSVFDDPQAGAEPTAMIGARDLAAQRALQARLDAGDREIFILSPGLVENRVPILERP